MKLNRAVRRQLMKIERRRPTRIPQRRVEQDNMHLAKLHATCLTEAERTDALTSARDGFRALREGVATYRQWAHVSTLVTVALAIEDQGVIRGMREHFLAAERAIDAVFRRVQDAPGGPTWGRSTTLYFQEIEALREAVHLHDEQLRVLSAAEIHAAVRAAERNVLAVGGQVLTATPLPTPQPVQEKLL